MNDIEMLGWKRMESKFNNIIDRVMYEKGNYWLCLDTRRTYNSHDYITIMVRDPAFENDKIGTDISHYAFSFIYRGRKTIRQLEKILSWEKLWTYEKKKLENEEQ